MSTVSPAMIKLGLETIIIIAPLIQDLLDGERDSITREDLIAQKNKRMDEAQDNIETTIEEAEDE